jgi:hypothetical protein
MTCSVSDRIRLTSPATIMPDGRPQVNLLA